MAIPGIETTAMNKDSNSCINKSIAVPINITNTASSLRESGGASGVEWSDKLSSGNGLSFQRKAAEKLWRKTYLDMCCTFCEVPLFSASFSPRPSCMVPFSLHAMFYV